MNHHLGSYKIVLTGAGNVGKTTWIKRIQSGQFELKHVPTLGVETYNIQMMTNKGPIEFNIWDCAGTERYRGLRDGYYIGVHGAIIMYDSLNPVSYNRVDLDIHDLDKTCGANLPKIIVANKYEDDLDIPYDVAVSTQNGYNLLEPLVVLARKLTHDHALQIVY